MDGELVQRAMRYAIEAHERIDQRRKYSNQPYDAHLRSVVETVASVSDDPQMLAAAWLHDVVEDTSATIEDIRREFGSGVAELVDELTDVSRPLDGNRAVRKAIDREHLAGASARAKTIKLADLIDNCEDICRADPRFGRVFVAEAGALLTILGEGDARLFQRCEKIVSKWRQKLLAKTARSVDESQPPPEPALGPHQRSILAHVLERFFAGDLAQPIDGARNWAASQMLAADAPLMAVVSVLTRHSNCIVSDGEAPLRRIRREDFGTPIARMWLFGILSAIELDIRWHIARALPDEQWTTLLSGERLGHARALMAERQRRGQSCELLSCVQLCDELRIITASPELLARTGFQSARAARRVFSGLEALRNNLAHGQPIGEEMWTTIARITDHLNEHRSEDGNDLMPVDAAAACERTVQPFAQA